MNTIACKQALLRGAGGWARGERELAIMSHKFEYLHSKSGREMLISQFDQVMTYYTFHARDFSTQLKMADSEDFICKACMNFFITFEVFIEFKTRTVSGVGSFASGQEMSYLFYGQDTTKV